MLVTRLSKASTAVLLGQIFVFFAGSVSGIEFMWTLIAMTGIAWAVATIAAIGGWIASDRFHFWWETTCASVVGAVATGTIASFLAPEPIDPFLPWISLFMLFAMIFAIAGDAKYRLGAEEPMRTLALAVCPFLIGTITGICSFTHRPEKN